MRLRRRPGTREKLGAYEDIVLFDPANYRGRWNTYFKNSNPLYIELGTGKGSFLTTMAALYPGINFIGVEKAAEVLLRAAKKAKQGETANLALLWLDVTLLDEVFAEAEVDRIYINFCDPWPKKRHAKRRLTHHQFLDLYGRCLKNRGQVHFKTDNEELFEFSLNEFCRSRWQLQNICLDVAQRGPEDNVRTEYETKFTAQGHRIYRCEAVKPDLNETTAKGLF